MGEGRSRQRERQVPRSCGQVCLTHLRNCMGSGPPSWWGDPKLPIGGPLSPWSPPRPPLHPGAFPASDTRAKTEPMPARPQVGRWRLCQKAWAEGRQWASAARPAPALAATPSHSCEFPAHTLEPARHLGSCLHERQRVLGPKHRPWCGQSWGPPVPCCPFPELGARISPRGSPGGRDLVPDSPSAREVPQARIQRSKQPPPRGPYSNTPSGDDMLSLEIASGQPAGPPGLTPWT